jgi:hypothetical protein
VAQGAAQRAIGPRAERGQLGGVGGGPSCSARSRSAMHALDERPPAVALQPPAPATPRRAGARTPARRAPPRRRRARSADPWALRRARTPGARHAHRAADHARERAAAAPGDP